MKKTIRLLMTLVVIVSLVGCSSKSTPFTDVYDYTIENGTPSLSPYVTLFSKTTINIDSKGISYTVGAVDDIIEESEFKDDYKDSLVFETTIKLDGSSIENTVLFFVKEDSEVNWIYFQRGTSEDITSLGKVDINNYDISVVENGESTENSLKFVVMNFLSLLINDFEELMESMDFSYTYKDFGFGDGYKEKTSEYAALSKIEGEEEQKNRVAPIDINSISIEENSIGIPNLFASFTNNSDKKIVAIDFYVKCYDAYGEIVEGYDRYNVFVGRVEDLNVGASSSTDGYWTLSGYRNTKTVEIAVQKYKFEGEEEVILPDSEMIWFKME